MVSKHLARWGGNKGDLFEIVACAVQKEVFRQTVEEIQDQNADAPRFFCRIQENRCQSIEPMIFPEQKKDWYPVGEGWEASWYIGKEHFLYLRNSATEYEMNAGIVGSFRFGLPIYQLSLFKESRMGLSLEEQRAILERGVEAVRIRGGEAYIEGDPPPPLHWYSWNRTKKS